MSGSVLIIDGDPTFAENAQAALEQAGLTVHVRFDGSVDDVRSLRPQVLMLSAELPRGSGFGICSRIRRDRTLRDMPIFITTAEAPAAALSRHAQSAEPANDYARKDIAMADLVSRVGKLIAQAPAPEPTTTPAGPPPLPPPRPAKSAPPAPVEGAPLEELWPGSQWTAAWRQAGVELEAGTTGRATPEQRLAQLRQLVKHHEARERSYQALWEEAMERGQLLARRVITLTADLTSTQGRLDETERALDDSSEQLASVQTEFKTFEAEIRRIFSEKDAEEQASQAKLAELGAARDELTAALEAAKERHADD